MLFVVHALDKKDMMPVRAKHYRDHRIHLDKSPDHGVDVVTAGTLVADDGETPAGSIFVIDAADRAAVDAFTKSDPYHVNGVWERVSTTATTRSAARRSRAEGRTMLCCAKRGGRHAHDRQNIADAHRAR